MRTLFVTHVSNRVILECESLKPLSLVEVSQIRDYCVMTCPNCFAYHFLWQWRIQSVF